MSAKDELMGAGMSGDEEDSESETEKSDEDAVAKSMYRRLKTALKGDDDQAGVDAFKKLLACMPGGDDDYSDSEAEAE